MKALAIFILFIGLFLVLKGYYSNKYKKATTPKVVIKYVPRDEYEAQLSDELRLAEFYKGLFEGTQPNIYNSKINIDNK